MLKNFLAPRIEKWKRLEDLTARASRLRLRNLSGEEVREFGRLYRRTAADLAIAREEVRDGRLINYLNHLVARAHGAIYRSESSGFGAVVSFYRYEVPSVFRRTFRHTLLSFLIFLASGMFAFTVCQIDEKFADRIQPGMRQNIEAHRDWTQSLNEAKPLGWTNIQSNNITVTFFAFAGGVLFGVGTFVVLVQNGLMLGTVFSLCIKHKFWDILIFVTGHGVLELTAIFIAGGAGLLIGTALLMPGDFKRTDALMNNGLLAIKLILGCIPMLIIAALIEAFVSPIKTLSPWYKYGIAVISLILMAAYFSKPDLRGTPVDGSRAG